MFDRRLLSNFDWILCLVVLAICTIGVFAIHSATIGSPNMAEFKIRQMYWIVLGIGVALGTTLIDYRILTRWAYFFHFSVILLLIITLYIGVGGTGSQDVKRWLLIGGLGKLQPSEFSKFSMILVLAHHFRKIHRIGNIGFVALIWPTILMIIPFALIIKQPDLGTALLLLIIFIPMIFLAGIKKMTMLFLGIILIIASLVAWFGIPIVLKPVINPYQRDRILTVIDPDRDPLGKGYQAIQSKIAVGSGEIWGKGFENGTQGKLNFLPFDHTDFIYAVFAEEWGFVGGIVLLLLYIFLILWSLSSIVKTTDPSGAILVIGIVSIITSQVLINVGMVIGLLPVVGMPLPFFSYGGSSMLSMMVGIGLLLNVRMRRFRLDPNQ